MKIAREKSKCRPATESAMKSSCSCCGWGKVFKTLAACAEGERALICSNDDLKTLEIGFCAGSVVQVLHNEPGALNLIVKIQGQRYAIPRLVAQNIKVK